MSDIQDQFFQQQQQQQQDFLSQDNYITPCYNNDIQQQCQSQEQKYSVQATTDCEKAKQDNLKDVFNNSFDEMDSEKQEQPQEEFSLYQQKLDDQIDSKKSNYFFQINDNITPEGNESCITPINECQQEQQVEECAENLNTQVEEEEEEEEELNNNNLQGENSYIQQNINDSNKNNSNYLQNSGQENFNVSQYQSENINNNNYQNNIFYSQNNINKNELSENVGIFNSQQNCGLNNEGQQELFSNAQNYNEDSQMETDQGFQYQINSTDTPSNTLIQITRTQKIQKKSLDQFYNESEGFDTEISNFSQNNEKKKLQQITKKMKEVTLENDQETGIVLEQVMQKYQLGSKLFKQVMEQTLENIEVEDAIIQQLSQIERSIYDSFLTKKQQKSDTKSQENKDNKQKQSVCNKRVEEKQKMVFKKAFTHIENEYFSENKKKQNQRIHKKNKNYTLFYKNYFQKTAIQEGIEIERFYHPQRNTTTRKKPYKNVKQINPLQKSFNQKYIDLTLKSDSFKNKVWSYVNKQFLEEVYQERKQKIDKFIDKCDTIIKESIDDTFQNKNKISKSLDETYIVQKIQESLQNYILRNSKCKIPWTNLECQEVQAYAISYLEGYEKNQNQPSY